MTGTWSMFGISFVTWIVFWILLFTKMFSAEERMASYGYSEFPIFQGQMRNRWFWLGVVILLASLGLTAGWMRSWIPWFQPLWFHMFFNNPGLWIFWIAGVVTAGVVGLLVGVLARSAHWGIVTGVIVGVIGVLGIGIMWAVLAGSWTQNHVYKSLTYEQIAELPETTAIRYHPLHVAEKFGESRLQEPAIGLGKAEPMVFQNEVNWVLPRIPKGSLNSALKKADGFAIVDSTGNVSMVRQRMQYGQGMKISDSISWQLRKLNYWSKIHEIYYVQGPDNEVVAVVPYINYKLRFPVQIPYWGGVFLVHSSGQIEKLTPQQAAEHALLKGVRIFPEKLAKLYAQAYAYKQGIGNKLFSHRDQISIPQVGNQVTGDTNEMPFLLPTTRGQKWFVATTPWKAEGIYRIFLVDAVTGRIELFELGEDSALIGPNRMREFIPNGFPSYDWSKQISMEPRPVVRQGVLFWMFTITTPQFIGVTNTVLVNSKTEEMLSFGDDKNRLLRFLKGEETGVLVAKGGTVVPSLPTLPPISRAQPGELSQEKVGQLLEQIRQVTKSLEELQRSLEQKR